MTEQEYISTKALGTITAAINTLSHLCIEGLEDVIKDGESKKVLGTLYDWQDRLFKQTEIREVSESFNCAMNSVRGDEKCKQQCNGCKVIYSDEVR